MRKIVIRVVLVAGLLYAGAQAAAPETYHFRAGDLILQVEPALPGGRLTMPLGPIGDLTWTTHTGPFNIEASFHIGGSASSLPSPAEFRDLRLALLLRKVPWILMFGALGGALIIVDGSWRHRARAMLIGAGAVVGAVAIAGAIAAFTFDASRLADPRYRGAIKDAPRILQLLKEVQRDWSGVERNINRAVAGLQRLHTQVVTNVPATPQDTTRLLLISDIHNNPLGLLIAEELATRFEVDGILNAGDFTDRGTAPEGELFASFGDLGLPQVIAPGNHEDRATLERAKRIPDAIVFEPGNDLAEIAGITVIGAADPNAFFIDSNPFNELAEERVPVLCEGLAARWADVRPQVVLVHDPRLGECAAERAREEGAILVFAWGHLHAPAYEQRGTMISVSPGSSGAAGFKSDVVLPYGFSLLEFDRTSGEPISICNFLFVDPSTLEQSTCHIVAGRLEPEPEEPASPTPTTSPTGTPSPGEGSVSPSPSPTPSP